MFGEAKQVRVEGCASSRCVGVAAVIEHCRYGGPPFRRGSKLPRILRFPMSLFASTPTLNGAIPSNGKYDDRVCEPEH